MANNYGYGKIVTDGLILVLDAADKNSYPGSGTTWNDLSKNKNNGTLINSPTYNSANNGIFILDGTDDYITMDSTPYLPEFTVDVWFQIAQNKNYNSLFQIGLDGGENVEILFFSDGRFHAPINFTTGRFGTDFSNFISNTNVWYHISYSYKSSEGRRVYRNGTFFGSDSENRTIATPSSNSFFIGGEPSTSRYTNGKLGIVHVYNRALSAQEVLQNYNAQKTRFN